MKATQARIRQLTNAAIDELNEYFYWGDDDDGLELIEYKKTSYGYSAVFDCTDADAVLLIAQRDGEFDIQVYKEA